MWEWRGKHRRGDGGKKKGEGWCDEKGEGKGRERTKREKVEESGQEGRGGGSEGRINDLSLGEPFL